MAKISQYPNAAVMNSGDIILGNQNGVTKTFSATVMKNFLGTIVGPEGPSGSQGVSGISVVNASIDGNGDLQLTLSNSSLINAGHVVGSQGISGVSVSATEVDINGDLIIYFSDTTSANSGHVVGPQGIQGTQGVSGVSVSGAYIDGNGDLIVLLSNYVQNNTGHVVGSDGTSGIGITSTTIDGNGDLIITYSDTTSANVGHVVGPAGSGSSASAGVNKVITQPNSFSIGNVVYYDGANYNLALANNATTLGLWIIAAATSADFTIQQAGYMEGFTGLTPGEYHYLSDTISGALTIIESSVYSNPLVFAISASAGWVLPFRPNIPLNNAALINYSEVTYQLPVSGTLNIDISNGNVQTCSISAAISIQWPTKSLSSRTTTITLLLTQPATAQTITFINNTVGSEGLDITPGGFYAPAANKRTLITATSIANSQWLYTQVWREP